MANRTTLLYIRTASALRRGFARDEGAGMVEYALLLALIGIVLIVAVGVFATALDDKYSSIASSVEAA